MLILVVHLNSRLCLTVFVAGNEDVSFSTFVILNFLADLERWTGQA
jgi:hypothetical protein